MKAAGKFAWIMRRAYMLVFLLSFLIILFGAFLAPVLMHSGFETIANILYHVYRLSCHQLPYRSFFLFGEQPFYPLESANITGLKSFEEAISPYLDNSEPIRSFIGNDVVGYKTAICERDIAIFASLALFSLVFFLTGNRLSRLHWALWILLAIVPMGIDGFSQMLSRIIPDIISLRESTPQLRIITGGMFGFFTGWFLFPYLEKTLD